MINIPTIRAENRLVALEKSQKKALSEQEEKAKQVAENRARLRALRLAKEAEMQTDNSARTSEFIKHIAKGK